jgi:8-oxo-dGTP diphosphatase
MLFDFLFQIWRRFSGPFQWWSIWLFSSKFMVSVSGVVFDEAGRILLQRHRHWVPDVWGLPGGIVKSGECLENAFAREVFEETGLVISDIELVRLNSGYKLRLEVYFRARLSDCIPPQTMKLQEQEVIEARFFPLDNLPVNVLPLQSALIDSIRKG